MCTIATVIMQAHHRLREWREANNYTASKLAKDLEVFPSTISRIEAGESVPTINLAAKIAKLTKGKVPVVAWAKETSKPKKGAA